MWNKGLIIGWIWSCCLATVAFGQQHPTLTLTKEGVQDIRKQMPQAPLFMETLEQMQQKIDKVVREEIAVPVPKDPAGGYTHEKHKENSRLMYQASVLYQLTGEQKYAGFVTELLEAYAEMYPTLLEHPIKKSYAPGKLFWQLLNESVWLVYVAQAYDGVYDYLTEKQRERITTDLLKPFAHFLSAENPEVFNRIHNHGVWAVAAVGMTGYVLEDQALVNKALYGMELTAGIAHKEKGEAGFYTHLDALFSPDGYYTEGPYYHRYALTPFMLFALAIENNEPKRQIFKYRDGILLKTVETLLQLTNVDGTFFPFNDAIKGMDYTTSSLVAGVDLLYAYGKKDPALLSIVEEQNTVLLNQAGLNVALALADGKQQPFNRTSLVITDGSSGDEGGIGILRTGKGKEQWTTSMKYTSHGLSHGHFDKLSLLMYEGAQEILQDYGAVRYVNVKQKEGGRYLPENKTWAHQTIAHNTLIVDETSHYDGDKRKSSKHHGVLVYAQQEKEFQALYAMDTTAYSGVRMGRKLVMIEGTSDREAVMLDVFSAESEEVHQYDLAYHYQGQVMNADFIESTANQQMQVLGQSNGYQHLWKEGEGISQESNTTFTWLKGNRFYSIASINETGTRYLLGRLGANDPKFNLRRDPVLIQRRTGKHARFINVIIPHGGRNQVTELTNRTETPIAEVKELTLMKGYEGVTITWKNGEELQVFWSTEKTMTKDKHQIEYKGYKYQWEGPVYVSAMK
ncbi:alginate lyase family protein [Algivirga pacifica]|uniref:Alginate lyase n=1 Tax=Algivirga pacifica TaxID=1162670 RepID=A0ABP9DJX1_9BACT